MNKLYGIRNCDSCRKAQKWLEAHDIAFSFHDIREDGLSDKRLKHWQKSAGWEMLINKRSVTWRKIPPFDRNDLDADSARALILEFPTVMKRPVFDAGRTVLIGFDPNEYQSLRS